MKPTTWRTVVAVLFLAASALAQKQKFVELGDFKLESGQVIRDCRIGYRTYGKLNADSSNIIVTLTWAGGTSEEMATADIGPGQLYDSDRFFVIAIDAFANGVTTSPSNSAFQPRMSFPKFTMRDMVNAQHQLLTQDLKIKHVRAISGTSMGGMQTFQWMVSFPDFMDLAISISGSPRLSAYDLLHWQTQIDSLTNHVGWNNGNYKEDPTRVTNAEFGMLLLNTPEQFNRTHTREQVAEELAKAATTLGQDPNNKIRQTQAMMSLDVSRNFNGSLERAAHAVKAKVLIVVATQDHVVTPGPARDFGKMLGVPVIELTGDCGHLASSCEQDKVKKLVSDFLAQK